MNKGGKLTEDPNFCLSSETLRPVLGMKHRLAQDLLHSPGYPLTDSNASVSQVLRIQVIHGATYFSKRTTTKKSHKITSSLPVKIPTVWLPKTDLKNDIPTDQPMRENLTRPCPRRRAQGHG